MGKAGRVRPRPTPEPLMSIPEFAKLRQCSRKTLWRTLRALCLSDEKERGKCDWLFRVGANRKYWINLTRLEAAHPALFHARYVTREDFDGLEGRVTDLEDAQRESKRRANALAGAVREIRAGAKR